MPMAPMVDEAKPIILASGSSARRAMLTQAGVAFTIEPARIDETAIRDELLRREPLVTPPAIALILASAKARDVSARNGGAVVVGSDQILNIGETLLTKPVDRAAAAGTLVHLRGRPHQLHSAAAIAIDGAIVWGTVDTANLTMRRFSDEFLEQYLDAEGDSLLEAVGAFKLEGRGLQLFEHIEGDYFTILGMPLLPVLAELRVQGAITS